MADSSSGVFPPMPSLESLRLFVEVLRLGSVSRAASAIGMAQPSASVRLHSLERVLGVQLLERRSSGSVPTDAGVVVAQWATSVLTAMEELRVGVGALRGERSSQLKVAASFTVAEHLLPAWLARFRQAHPEVGAELEVANSAHVVLRVREGVDLGFVESPEIPKDLAGKIVATDELVVVVPPNHPWIHRKQTVTAAQLAATPLVVREAGSGTRDFFERALAMRGVGPLVVQLALGSSSAVVAAVLGRAGPGVLSRLAVDFELQSERLFAIPIDGLDLRRNLWAVWSRQQTLSMPARMLLGEGFST